MTDCAAPWTVDHQAPLPMEFSRQEYWRWMPFPTLEDLPDPGIEPSSLASSALGGRFCFVLFCFVFHHQCHLGSPEYIVALFNIVALINSLSY